MERLINIDNGGTLTDICVWDGSDFTYTKTLTTPFDLSKCLFDGMTKASASIFGEPRTWKRCCTARSTSGTPRRRAPTPWWSARARGSA